VNVLVRKFELEDDGSYCVGEGRICLQTAAGRNILSAWGKYWDSMYISNASSLPGRNVICFIKRVHKITKSDYLLRHVCHSAWNNSAPTGRISVNCDIRVVFENLSRKFMVSLKSDKNKEYFTWNQIYIFFISRLILLRMKKISDVSCRETRNTHFLCQ
jgi:hypothetical protein